MSGSEPVSFEERKLMARAGLEPVLNSPPKGLVTQMNEASDTARNSMAKLIVDQKQREANDARKLQLMIARVQKAIGNKAESNVVVGTCVHILAQVILQIPMAAHSTILQNIVHGIETCVVSGYPKEMVEKMKAEREATASKLSQEVIDQMADAVAENFADGVPKTDQG